MTGAPEDNGDIGLNLVYSAPAPSAAAGSGGLDKKLKRKTKYDRRREKGRQTNLAKEDERNRQQQPRARRRGDGGTAVDEREAREEAGGSSSSAGVAAASGDSAKGGKSAFARAPALVAAGDVVLETKDAKSKTSDEGIDNADAERTTGSPEKMNVRLNNNNPAAEPSALASRPSTEITNQPASSLAEDAVVSSRRHRTQASLTEEQRTDYLSEFHARPRDLDRGEGASKDIKASCASDHIFGRADYGDNEGEDGSDAGHDATKDGDAEKETDGKGKGAPSDDGPETNPAPAATCAFQKLGLHSRLVSALTSPNGKFKLSQPTIVQSRSVAALLPRRGKNKRKKGDGKLGQNLFIQSETGSGKTLAYLLPILQHLAVDPRTQDLKRVDRRLGGTRAILLCPTRELATQTYAIAERLCGASYPWIVPGCLSGGEKRKSEKARLRKGIAVLIATPGRLLDHLSKTESLLAALKNRLEWLVLDEADRLLDAGLGGQVEQIVQHLRSNQPGAGPKRDGVTWRSVLVSATVTGELEGLAGTLLGGEGWMWARGHAASSNGKGKLLFGQEPLDNEEPDAEPSSSSDRASSNNELDNAAPRQLVQLYMVVSAKLRLSSLVAFLSARAAKGERTVVFVSTCDSVDYHHALFTAMESILGEGDDDKEDSNTEGGGGIFGKTCPIYKLHGDVPHEKRLSTLEAFNRDSSGVLIATDVAARGLNFTSLDWIVQYDPPCETKDYVHRAGRSARAGQAGHALLFLLPSERQYVEVLGLRGLKGISALSLSSTLTAAAAACRGVAREGGDAAAGNYSDGTGEAFTSGIQNRLEQRVLRDDVDHRALMKKKAKGEETKKRRQRRKDAAGPLLEGARKAFAAFVRAYPAKEKAVRHIFNARALHLGHIARSLALKETPKMVSKGNSHSGKNASGGVDGNDGGEKKRKSPLAFGGKLSEGDGDDAAAIEDGERERNLSLLGAAIGGETGNSSGKGLPPRNKKFKSSKAGGGDGGGGGGRGNVQRRMMEAATRMQSQEFL